MSLKSRVLQWLSDEPEDTAALPGPDADYWYTDRPSLAPGYEVTPRTAHAIDTVYACVDRYGSTISSLPFQVFERLRNGGKRLAPEHPLYYVIHDSPNAEMSAVEFWYTVVSHIELYGNAVARQVIDSRNDVAELQLLLPWKMEVKRDRDTGVRYYVYHHDGIAEPETLFDDTVLHIPGPGYDGFMGYSPIEVNRRTFGAAASADEYTSRFLANNGIPPAYVSVPNKLSERSLAQLLKYFAKYFNKGSAGKLGILQEGGEIKTVAINHRDLQYIELRKFQVEQICRIFNMPPHRVQSLDRATNNNIEHQDIEYVKHSIMPRCRRIESRINKQLFGPVEGNRFFAEFNLDAMYRGDMVSRAQAFSTRIFSGQLKINEARGFENLNPDPNGDELIVQSAMVPLRRIFEDPPEPAPAAEPAPTEEGDNADANAEDEEQVEVPA